MPSSSPSNLVELPQRRAVLPSHQSAALLVNTDHPQGRAMGGQELVSSERMLTNDHELVTTEVIDLGDDVIVSIVAEVLSGDLVLEAEMAVLFGAEPQLCFVAAGAIDVRVEVAHTFEGDLAVAERDGSAGGLLDDDEEAAGPGDGVGEAVPRTIDDGGLVIVRGGGAS